MNNPDKHDMIAAAIVQAIRDRVTYVDGHPASMAGTLVYVPFEFACEHIAAALRKQEQELKGEI